MTLSLLLNAPLNRITSTLQTMFKNPKNLTAVGRSVLYSPFLNRTLVNAVSCGSRNRYWPWLVSKMSCSFCQFSDLTTVTCWTSSDMNCSSISDNVPVFLVEDCADVNTRNNILMSYKIVQERVLRIRLRIRETSTSSRIHPASSAARCMLSIITTEVRV